MGRCDPDWHTTEALDGRVLPPWIFEIVEAACGRFRVCASPDGADGRAEDVADAVVAIARGHAAAVARHTDVVVTASGPVEHEVAVVDGFVVDLCARTFDPDGVWPQVYRIEQADRWWPCVAQSAASTGSGGASSKS